MRVPNAANSLVAVGLIALGISFSVPAWSGRRVARVESRALEVAIALRGAGRELLRRGLADQPFAEQVTDRLRSICASFGHPESDLPERIDAPESSARELLFGNRHYLFVLTRSTGPDSPAARRDFQVYAWPRTLLPPGRSTFVVPNEGRAAFTRNLAAEYAGIARRPEGDAGLPRPENASARPGAYRGNDDERWIYLRSLPRIP